MNMNIVERIHFLHRAWRYRLRTERDELNFVRSCDLRGGAAIDVGANRGIYSYWMHQGIGKSGRVLAFEPQPELGAALRRLKATFGLEQLEIENVALSSSAGQLTLVRPRGFWAAASFHLDPTERDTERLAVRVTKLDGYLIRRDLPPVKLIKCDVQDHEEQVFRGAEQLLKRDRPILLFEQLDECDSRGRLFAFLDQLDYTGYFFYRERLTPLFELPALRPRIKRPYLNYVFLNRDAARIAM
jgi:FkbM family methyltransferase